jgi:hypothetical protein
MSFLGTARAEYSVMDVAFEQPGQRDSSVANPYCAHSGLTQHRSS